jgi:hypothetical protein
MAAVTRGERRAIRHAVRQMWLWTMFLTVLISICVRRQKFIELEWWWTPLVAVCVNAICWWLAIQEFWGRAPKGGDDEAKAADAA